MLILLKIFTIIFKMKLFQTLNLERKWLEWTAPDSLEKLIDSMLSGKDEEGNAVEYALPAYDYNQSDYDRQLGVTAADVLSGAAMPQVLLVAEVLKI